MCLCTFIAPCDNIHEILFQVHWFVFIKLDFNPQYSREGCCFHETFSPSEQRQSQAWYCLAWRSCWLWWDLSAGFQTMWSVLAFSYSDKARRSQQVLMNRIFVVVFGILKQPWLFFSGIMMCSPIPKTLLPSYPCLKKWMKKYHRRWRMNVIILPNHYCIFPYRNWHKVLSLPAAKTGGGEIRSINGKCKGKWCQHQAVFPWV